MTRRTRLSSCVLGALLLVAVAGCGASGPSDTSSKGDRTATTERSKATTTTERNSEDTTTTEAGDTTSTTEASGGGADYQTSFDTDAESDGWDTGCDKKGCVGIEDGHYYTDVSPNAQFLLAADDFRDVASGDVSIDLGIEKFGAATPLVGAACMGTVADNTMSDYYDLLISSSGNASIYKFPKGGEGQELVGRTPVLGFEAGKPFSLGITCTAEDDGVHLDIGVDGQLAASYVDDDDPFESGVVRIETLGDEKQLSTVHISDFHIQAH